ncbi:hypothetical protein PIB30_056110, partial [Stylosanthes scabra]|nr:hypothetical protein [Stylosanthes scabra]
LRYRFNSFMAWDLWGSTYDQVSCKDNYLDHPEWPCGFFFGCDPDVIEEDALNEEYCVQVLRILITKADTEIKELEKDLSSLQNELACAEHEKWPEICCNALTERIKLLDVAISALKKDHAADEMETGMLLHSKPAETLNEIVKALQRDHCQDENSQPLVGENILNPIVNATECALDKESSKINSNIVIKEEKKEQEETTKPEEIQLSGNSEKPRNSSELSEIHRKRLDRPEIVDIADMVEVGKVILLYIF